MTLLNAVNQIVAIMAVIVPAIILATRWLGRKLDNLISNKLEVRLGSIQNSLAWTVAQLKPNGGTSLRDKVDEHTETIHDLVQETREQSKSLRRIEEGRGQTVATITEKIMAVHAAEGNRLTNIQDTVTAAKEEAANTAKVVKETLRIAEGA